MGVFWLLGALGGAVCLCGACLSGFLFAYGGGLCLNLVACVALFFCALMVLAFP